MDLRELAETHADGINERDGYRPIVVILSDDWFALLGCLQSKPIENGLRICDPVGEYTGFTVDVEVPFPGYFPSP